tara:strand:+ start:531 stop:1463 length:933 start_codon:yes stop_codon:yes gene_type:complete
MLSVEQVNELLQILDSHTLMFIGQSLGPDYLTKDEKKSLNKIGINPSVLYHPEMDTMKTAFYFGLISDALGKTEANKVTFKDLKQSIQKGEYLPLTYKEQATIHSAKMQYLGDIKANKGKIFNDVNGIIRENDKNNRAAYEEVIREELVQGIKDKKSAAQIASELGHKTGDWRRNFGRIAEFTSHQAFDEGRAALYRRKNGDDALVYKQPYDGACKHCTGMYLTKGAGSAPKIFKLTVLEANGTNIGKKTVDWKPVVGSTHPYCRCTLHTYDPDYEWDPDTGGFTKLKKKKRSIVRPKVKVTYGGKEYQV